MFTGLVADIGVVESIEQTADGVRIKISTSLAPELTLGASIATNGVCLTAIKLDQDSFTAEVMNESLRMTSLGALEPDQGVNLELPVTASDRLGGHIVQGHVDGLAELVEVAEDGFARRLSFQLPPKLQHYLVKKGSITVDGVSLTVADLEENIFTVSLIPETLTNTTLGSRSVGDRVNVEVDVIAKYIERLATKSLNEEKDV